MSGRHPWRTIRRKRDQTYWAELRFKRTAASLEDAEKAAFEVIAEAERLGWTYELGETTDAPPADSFATRFAKPS